MKAVMIRGFGGPEVLEIVDVPAPRAQAGEVVIGVAATSVNPVDWLVRDGGAKSFVKVRFPVILGCDLAGKVLEIGSNVTRFAVGDEVFAMMPHDWGAHAERVALPEDLVVLKPRSLTMAEAASIPTVAMTALVGLRERGGVQPGERVLVNGASGGVGLAAIQIAKALGASVTAVCGSGSFDLVKRLGAERAIDYKTTDFTTQSETYDVIFDCIGNQPYGACKRVLTGRRVHVTTMPRLSTLIRQLFNPLFRIRVYALITRGSGDQLAFIKSLVDRGELAAVVDRIMPLAEVAAAQEYSKTGRAKGKIVLTIAA